MVYNITDKLKFDQDPVIVICDTELTVKSDAEVVLELLDIVTNNGEVAAAVKAEDLLLSPEDKEKLRGLKLKTRDWLEVISAAMQLAFGSDPDESDEGEE